MPASPSRQEVRERLALLIKEIANIPTDHISDDATVDGELQMNSVAFVELQVAIEEDYDIQIDPVRVVELNQFGAIVDYVHHCVTDVAR
jgi:acyl carrier protein